MQSNLITANHYNQSKSHNANATDSTIKNSYRLYAVSVAAVFVCATSLRLVAIAALIMVAVMVASGLLGARGSMLDASIFLDSRRFATWRQTVKVVRCV